ncbi:hypothetical protein ASG49_17205 [Marmoricola sp. Leaf446]|uniref:hypothetical protein n=1 Tax=Marmoricola sp. Leaf446 TaxID=1736379 RepID=UPI0006FAE281|nr:hypothetical protein [Marmoricola sp. Leaf446]KQT89483.1 hypothetical protein ASG49_17205 [Marmoricola sp. Leaf446]
MSFTLLPDLAPFVLGFAALAGLGLVLALVGLVATTSVVAETRRARLRRHEGVLHYYGHLALGR